MNKILILITILSIIPAMAGAQQEDTTRVVPSPDSLIATPADSGSVNLPDTLKDRRKMLEAFEKRQQQFKQEKQKERFAAFSLYDSLVAYFTSPRLDQMQQVKRSFYKTAGDYFIADPSFFVVNYQSTPMRSTVQPFGLRGDRLAVISNGLPMTPFEHVVEPDGMMDMSDIPTAMDHNIYILPGPVGEIFGVDHSVASLITAPASPLSLEPHSSLLVDKGSFAYNFVRGRYSKMFTSGKQVDLSIGYRNADGQSVYRDDDASQYTGRTHLPIGRYFGVNASGYLYMRNGSYKLAGDLASNPHLTRARTGRGARVGLERYNSDHTFRTEAGYSYQLQGSNIDQLYKGRFQNTEHGFYLNQEWLRGSLGIKAQAEGAKFEFTDGINDWQRNQGKLSLTAARLTEGWRFAASGGGQYVEGVKWLPFSSLLVFRDGPSAFFMASVGYSGRAASLYELHLRPQQAAIYNSSGYQYADSGNANLRSEKQATANITFELGSVDNNIRLSTTGGRISDGIDWKADYVRNVSVPYLHFSPVNHDIDFYTVELQQKLRLSDLLYVRSGGSYHHIDNHGAASYYQPKYQAFSGLELHVYWPQRITHLYAYGEITYASEYDGYASTGYGDQLIANAKLSFQMKQFRFHYVFENVFNTIYDIRENFTISGRYNYFGFTWSFAD